MDSTPQTKALARPAAGLAAYATALVLAVYLLPAAWSPQIYTNDTREHVAWMAVYSDPELFTNDTLKSYYLDAVAPPGFKSVFWLTAGWLDPQTTAELAGILLGGVGAWLAWRIGRAALAGDALGGAAAVSWYLGAGAIAFQLHFIRWVQGGLQRAYLVPCFFLGILGLLTNRPKLCAAASVLGALFYPPASIMLGAVWLFHIVISAFREKRVPIGWSWFLLGNVAAITILLVVKPTGWSNYTLAEARALPDFFDRQLVVDAYLTHEAWPYFRELLPFPAPVVLGLIGSIAFLWWRRPRDVSWVLVAAMIVGAWVTYGFAYLVFNRLYEPARYLFPLRCLGLLLMPALFTEVRGLLDSYWRLPRAVVIAALVVATLGAAALCVRRVQHGEGGFRGPLPDAAYDFFASLPKTTLIAGHPDDTGDIPLRSRRRVLLIAESIYPCHKEFYEEMKRRYIDVLRSLTAADFGPILELRKAYGADYLVITDVLTSGRDALRTTSTFADEYRRIGAHEPIVRKLPGEVIVYADDVCKVIDLKKLAALQTNGNPIRGVPTGAVGTSSRLPTQSPVSTSPYSVNDDASRMATCTSCPARRMGPSKTTI
jgi:hypothetical protein